MYKINLIKGWKKIKLYKKFRTWVGVGLIVLVSIMVVSYFGLFVYLVILQRELSSLSNNQYQSQAINQYSPEVVSKTIYGLQKLDQIRNIDQAYPDYYKIHQFLISKILKQKSFVIEEYSLKKNYFVDMTITTGKLADIFTFLNTLQSDKVIKSFQVLELERIALQNNDEKTGDSFIVELMLQFHPDFVGK